MTRGWWIPGLMVASGFFGYGVAQVGRFAPGGGPPVSDVRTVESPAVVAGTLMTARQSQALHERDAVTSVSDRRRPTDCRQRAQRAHPEPSVDQRYRQNLLRDGLVPRTEGVRP